MTINRLRELIQQTHLHGVRLGREIQALQAQHRVSAAIKARALRVQLRGLEVLNARRRKELAKLEGQVKPAPRPPDPKPKPPAPKPQRFTMYDSTNVGNIPSDAEAVAGYVNGAFENFNELVRRFPHAKHLSIAVSSSHDADCLDIETGDATPADAPGWVRRQHARGKKRPVVYANTSTIVSVVNALARDGIKRSEYLVWTAHYTDTPHVEAGSDATQWEDHRELYDVSLCEPWFL